MSLVCDDAEGCHRFGGEFPRSMSGLEPGGPEFTQNVCDALTL